LTKGMVKTGSYAYCVDTTGVIIERVFKAFGASYKKNVTLGDAVYVVVRAVNTYVHCLKDEGVKNIIKYFIIVNIEWEVMRVKVNLLGVVGYVGSIVSKFSRINIIKPRRNYSTPLKFTTKAKEDVKKKY